MTPVSFVVASASAQKKHQQILLLDMAVQQEYQKEHNAIIQTYTGKGPQGKRHAPNQECCKQQLQRCFTLYRMAEYPQVQQKPANDRSRFTA